MIPSPQSLLAENPESKHSCCHVMQCWPLIFRLFLVDDVVDQRRAVNVGDAKGHLRLVVNENDGGVCSGVELMIVAHDSWM